MDSSHSHEPARKLRSVGKVPYRDNRPYAQRKPTATKNGAAAAPAPQTTSSNSPAAKDGGNRLYSQKKPIVAKAAASPALQIPQQNPAAKDVEAKKKSLEENIRTVEEIRKQAVEKDSRLLKLPPAKQRGVAEQERNRLQEADNLKQIIDKKEELITLLEKFRAEEKEEFKKLKEAYEKKDHEIGQLKDCLKSVLQMFESQDEIRKKIIKSAGDLLNDGAKDGLETSAPGAETPSRPSTSSQYLSHE